jgi:DNA-directed RNA polymerase II subunit RPB1
MEELVKKPLRPNVEKALAEIRTNPALQPITEPPLTAVKSIQFGILSPEEIKGISVCHVTNSRVTTPAIDTVYDERMGPSHSRGICSTCHEDIRVCPGHFGHIELAVPMIHPMFIKFIVTILNCICLKCSKLKMSREEIDLEINVLEYDRYIRYIDKLNIIVKKCACVAYCKECQYPYPTIKEQDGYIYKVYDAAKKKDDKKSRIEVDELQQILSKISIEDLNIMGFQPEERTIYKHGKVKEQMWTFRPEWMILTHLPVIPTMSRPPNNNDDGRSDDDLTTSYCEIIKYNTRLLNNPNEMNQAGLLLMTQRNVKGLFDNSDGAITRSTGKAAKGIRERIAGKEGHIRGKLVGKRVDCSARTVITADITLRLNELGVPEEIAESLSFPEKITARNMNEMKKLLDENKINTLIRNNQIIRVPFAIQAGRKIVLKYGDVIYRQLRDGDTVVFNRQPTLHRGSMMAHYVKVLPGKTFRMNLSVTTPYNADFDGDEMQAHVPQDYGTVVEVQTLMGVNKMIVSSQSNRPIMGAVQDALLGSYLLTHPNVKIARNHFMDCITSAGEKYIKNLYNVFTRAKEHYTDLYCGRVLFSTLLPADFHFKYENGVSKQEPTVVIKNGILISGIIDKKIIGRSHGSIIHRLYKEYSPEIAADFLSSLQFLINRWLSFRGFSVGMSDFIISDENEKGVELAIQKAYIEVQSIEESDDPPVLKEFRINNALNNRGQSLAINGLCKDNRLEVMIKSGSKGSQMNIIQITGHLGQNNVEGKRIQPEIDDSTRTLPCFERNDNHPKTRGFIENSFLKGLSPPEFWFHAKAGREGVINTAVKTRDSGYAERKLVKRMEDMIVTTDNTVRSLNTIISFNYGDSLDPTLIYENNGPAFVDIDNIVEKLNSEPIAEDINILDVNKQKLAEELDNQILEYTTCINNLKKNKDNKSKQLLAIAEKKLTKLKSQKIF